MKKDEQEENFATKLLIDQITSLVQRRIEEEEREELFQAMSIEDATPEVSNDLESQINAVKGSGRPLSENDRTFLEPRFGRDFSQVRVHTDAQAVETVRV